LTRCYDQGMRETEISKAILKTAQKHKRVARIFRVNSGMFKSFAGTIVQGAPKGTPDLIGFLDDGRFLAVEVKVPGEQPTPEQIEFLRQLNDAGGVGLVATSSEEFDALFNDSLGRGTSAS